MYFPDGSKKKRFPVEIGQQRLENGVFTAEDRIKKFGLLGLNYLLDFLLSFEIMDVEGRSTVPIFIPIPAMILVWQTQLAIWTEFWCNFYWHDIVKTLLEIGLTIISFPL